MRYRVPAYSQWLRIREKNWKPRSCGIIALAMLISYWNKKIATKELVITSRRVGAYKKGIGWTHKGLVLTAKKYGLGGNNFDWANLDKKTALKNLKKKLARYPVIASIHHRFNPKKGGHLIVLTGIGKNWVFYNDPDAKKLSAVRKTVSLKKFLTGWKKRIVAIHPQ